MSPQIRNLSKDLGVSKNWSNFAPAEQPAFSIVSRINHSTRHLQERTAACSRNPYGGRGLWSYQHLQMGLWLNPRDNVEKSNDDPHNLRFFPKTSYCIILEKNVNMNHNEEIPDFPGGLGDMLPAEVLKMVNELLEQLHRKDKDHQGSPVFIYAPGSQYVDKQFNIGAPLQDLRSQDAGELGGLIFSTI